MWKRPKLANDPSSAAEAYNYCLWLLGIRFYGRAELAMRLQRKGFEAAAIETCLNQLADINYLNDHRLLESLINGYKRRLYGPKWIWLKLRQKGFDSEQISRQLQEHLPAPAEAAGAAAYVKKTKLPVSANNFPKIAAALQRRGFSMETIYKVLKNIGGAES